MTRVLITGASGYIGSSVTEVLLKEGYTLSLASRKRPLSHNYEKMAHIPTFENFPAMSWTIFLQKVTVIVFCAGLAHKKTKRSSQHTHFEINVKAAINLAQQAKLTGIKKFVYISTIGINGKYSNEEINEKSEIYLKDSYVRSKYAAEKALEEIFNDTNIELIILRIPMVYGLNAPGNARRAVGLLRSGLAPVGDLRYNKRSFIFIENLKSAINFAVKVKGKHGVYCVSDGFTYSTYSYFNTLALLNNLEFKYLCIPSKLFIIFKKITKLAIFDSILENMVISNRKFSEEFNWVPPYKTHKEVTNWGSLNNLVGQ